MEKQYKIYDELAALKAATTSVPCEREFAKLCPAGSLLNLTVVRKGLAVFGSFFSSLKFLLQNFQPKGIEAGTDAFQNIATSHAGIARL